MNTFCNPHIRFGTALKPEFKILCSAVLSARSELLQHAYPSLSHNGRRTEPKSLRDEAFKLSLANLLHLAWSFCKWLGGVMEMRFGATIDVILWQEGRMGWSS